jgi:hypothetical protein
MESYPNMGCSSRRNLLPLFQGSMIVCFQEFFKLPTIFSIHGQWQTHSFGSPLIAWIRLMALNVLATGVAPTTFQV